MAVVNCTASVVFRGLASWEVETCVPYAQDFYEEMRLPGTIVPEVFVANWQRFIDGGIGTILVAQTEEFDLKGGIGGLVTPDVNDGRLVATEMFWFVRPEYRKGRTAFQLLDNFELWAKEKGAVEIQMHHLLTVGGDWRHDTFNKFYTRRGYRQVEVGWRKGM